MYVKVHALPSSLQTVLSSLNYARADIEIKASETYSLFAASGSGYRAFVVVVNLSDATSQITRGSWGGANMHNPRNSVDLDDTARPLPAGFAVIHGHEGGNRPVSASITANPATLAPLIAAPTVELSDMERRVLAWYKGLTSAGRKDAVERLAADRAYGHGKHRDQPRIPSAQTLAEIDAARVSLADKGLLKIAKNGATSITTEGRNLADTKAMYD